MPSGFWAFKVHVFRLFSITIRTKNSLSTWKLRYFLHHWNPEARTLSKKGKTGNEGWRLMTLSWLCAGFWQSAGETRCGALWHSSGSRPEVPFMLGFVRTTQSTTVWTLHLHMTPSTSPEGLVWRSAKLWHRSLCEAYRGYFAYPTLVLFSCDWAKPSHRTDFKMAL